MSRFWKWGDWGVTLKCQRPVYATVVIYWACIINQLKISETKIDFFDPKIIPIFINWLELKPFRTKNKFPIILMIELGSLKSLEMNLGPKYPTRSCSKQNKWKWKFELLTHTLSAWPLRGHPALKSIWWETLFLD